MPLKAGWHGRIVPRVPMSLDREVDDWFTVSGSDQAIAARLGQAVAAGADGFLLLRRRGRRFRSSCGFATEIRPRLLHD